MGRFQLGSTVIVLFPKDSVTWHSHLQNAVSLKMGESIAVLAVD